jgi:hypothetical protein
MASSTSTVPVRVPERPAPTTEVATPRPADSRQERKPTRFVIKLSTPIPC